MDIKLQLFSISCKASSGLRFNYIHHYGDDIITNHPMKIVFRNEIWKT